MNDYTHNAHGAHLVFWSTDQGRAQNPATAIATLKDGKLTAVDAKLKSLLAAGTKITLAKHNNRYVLDCGFLGIGDPLPPMDTGDSKAPAIAYDAISEATAPKTLAEAQKPVDKRTQRQKQDDQQWERLRQIEKEKNTVTNSPAAMSAYLQAAING